LGLKKRNRPTKTAACNATGIKVDRSVEAEFDDDPPLLPPDPALEVDCDP